MVSERQIAANRRNARKSTGPRSRAGKERARGNAYRHGLSSNFTPGSELDKKIEELARKIAGGSQGVIVLEQARAAAQAEFDLARIRAVKVGLIERAYAFGALDPPRPLTSTAAHFAFINLLLLTGTSAGLPQPVEAAPPMPERGPDRLAEAVRRVLPELSRLERYESRAASRRNKALQAIRQLSPCTEQS
jgi:hypothetical protein